MPTAGISRKSLAAEITRAERFGGTLALVLADLDDFKQVNDLHGHQAGDDVLRTFARILRETVREIDLPARYGGEEFAVFCLRPTSKAPSISPAAAQGSRRAADGDAVRAR